jgi:putative ABC transport system substrate-binding protein
VVSNEAAAVVAKRATTSIPIVFAASTDPIARGLVASLARPGGNVTGLSNFGFELAGKRLDLAKQLIRRATRMAFLHVLGSSPTLESLRQTEAAAKSLGIKLQVLEVRGLADLEAAFQSASKAGARALLIPGTSFVYLNRARIAELAKESYAIDFSL